MLGLNGVEDSQARNGQDKRFHYVFGTGRRKTFFWSMPMIYNNRKKGGPPHDSTIYFGHRAF